MRTRESIEGERERRNALTFKNGSERKRAQNGNAMTKNREILLALPVLPGHSVCVLCMYGCTYTRAGSWFAVRTKPAMH